MLIKTGQLRKVLQEVKFENEGQSIALYHARSKQSSFNKEKQANF